MNVQANRIYNMSASGLLECIPDETIDLTITSPPYDNMRDYEGFEWLLHDVVTGLYGVTKEGGIVVWVVSDQTINGSETGTSFYHAKVFMDCGFRLHDTMIYLKDNPPPIGGDSRYYNAFEYMFVFSKGQPSAFNALKRKRRNKHNDRRTVRHRDVTRKRDGSFSRKVVLAPKPLVKKTNVWTYTVGGGNSTKDKIAYRHPATFPEKLARDHILSWSKRGDIVLDPMCGSGTVPKMALLNGRYFIGNDLSKYYCMISQIRISRYRNKLKLAYKNPIY